MDTAQALKPTGIDKVLFDSRANSRFKPFCERDILMNRVGDEIHAFIVTSTKCFCGIHVPPHSSIIVPKLPFACDMQLTISSSGNLSLALSCVAVKNGAQHDEVFSGSKG